VQCTTVLLFVTQSAESDDNRRFVMTCDQKPNNFYLYTGVVLDTVSKKGIFCTDHLMLAGIKFNEKKEKKKDLLVKSKMTFKTV
jgi:hypothetical protein